jgi:hypothetical protein
MAHFAELNAENTVQQILVVDNSDVDNLPFPESEPIGVAYLHSIFGPETLWVQTSYNGSFRYCYASIGNTFDSTVQPYGVFLYPKPYPSWILDTNTYMWIAPVPYPNDGKNYYWDEATLSWVLVEGG